MRPQKLTDEGELDNIRDYYFQGDPRGGDGLEDDERAERALTRRRNNINQSK